MFLPILILLNTCCTCYARSLIIEMSNMVEPSNSSNSRNINLPNNNIGNDTTGMNTSETISKKKKQKLVKNTEAELGRNSSNVDLCANGKQYCRHPFNYPYQYFDHFNYPYQYFDHFNFPYQYFDHFNYPYQCFDHFIYSYQYFDHFDCCQRCQELSESGQDVPCKKVKIDKQLTWIALSP